MATNPMINVKGGFHFAIIKDVDSTIEHFWNQLGIGPWQVMTLFKDEPHGMTLYGKPVSIEVRAAITQVGDLVMAVDQALSRPNPYEQIVDQRGGGAHHLALLVDSVEQSTEIMKRLPSKDGAGSYFDTIDNLGTVIELAHLPSGGMPSAEKTFPYPVDVAAPSKIKIKDAVHVGIAVKDVEKAAGHYQNEFGIGPWQINTVGPDVKKTTYHGKESDVVIKQARAQIGPMVVVLEQPVSGPSPVNDFLESNGQGIHHICLEVDEWIRS